MNTQIQTEKNMFYVVVGAAIAAILGAFLPWASVVTIFGTISVNGMSGDGQLSSALAFGLLLYAGYSIVTKTNLHSAFGYIASGFGVLILIVGAYSYSEISSRGNGEENLTVQIGSGLYLTVLAGIVLVVVGFLLARSMRNSQADQILMTSTEVAAWGQYGK